MKTSRNGALVMTGRGLEEVRKQIKERFALVREQNAKPIAVETGKEPRPIRPLAEIAAPILKVAAARFTSFKHSRHQDTYVVTSPSETAEELFSAAAKAVDQVCPAMQNAKRFVVEHR